MRNAITGESYDLGFALVERITPDGGYVAEGVDELQIFRRGGEEVRVIPFADLGAGEDSLDGLVVGDDLQVVGMSEGTLVVATCYAPTPTSVIDEAAGSRTVLAAVSLTDGARRWVRDTGAVCAGTDVVAQTPPGIEPTTHLVVREGDGRTRALRIDDGAVRQTWTDTPFGRVVVQGDLAAARDGDTVSVTDLRTAAEVEQVRCDGAKLANPGGFTDQLSRYATLGVTCSGQESYVLDAQERTAVRVAAGALDGQQLPDGRPVLYDRVVLTRSGDEVTITDAFGGRRIAVREIPADFLLATNDPRGRVMRLYLNEDARDGGIDSQHLAVDLPTGAWVVPESTRLSPGADVSPQGLTLYSSTGVAARGSGRARQREIPPRTWLVAPPDVATPR